MEALVLVVELPWSHFAAEGGWATLFPPAPPPRRGTSVPVAETVDLPLRIGSRSVGRIRRRLVRRSLSLAEAMAPHLPPAPRLPETADGFLLTSVPLRGLEAVRASHPGLLAVVRQRYGRCYAELDGSYESWLAGLSSKSRSTLKRKLRRFAERSCGSVDLRRYALPQEMAEFHRLARRVSALSYQERRLGCGLPDGPETHARLHSLAERDAVRGWILFLDGAPVSYLYAPADGEVLVYEHLGYDPGAAQWSPGIVLQAGAMRQLFAEKRFRLFDFTEGGGRHKSLFATGKVPCADLLMLRRTAVNRLAASSLAAFDGAVAAAKNAATALGLGGLAAKARR